MGSLAGARNDQTEVKLEPFVTPMKQRQYAEDLPFELLSSDSGYTNAVKAGWLLFDGAFHAWCTFQFPD